MTRTSFGDTHGILAGTLDAATTLSSDEVEPGRLLSHQLRLCSIIAPAQLPAMQLTCRLGVSPGGWATLEQVDPASNGIHICRYADTTQIDIDLHALGWAAPPAGRLTIDGMYTEVAEVVRCAILPMKDPPYIHGSRQQIEVQTEFIGLPGVPRRLHDRFWIVIS